MTDLLALPESPPFRWGPGRLPVPYATRWSSENSAVGRALIVRPGGRGLGYRDETPGDRDRHGVLWARLGGAPGRGRPDFRAMHSGRQRDAMLGMRCQVCGGPADRTSRGWLFLLQRHGPAERAGDWPEGALCTKPPVCTGCARLAVRHCPHLTEPALVRCRKPRVWGVFGGFAVPGEGGRLWQSPEDEYLPYGHPAARWFLASQIVVELTRCTGEPAG